MLAERLAEGLSIKHGSVVERVDWGSEVVTIHCLGGQQLQADAVIVTVSLGVLKVQRDSTSAYRLKSCPSVKVSLLRSANAVRMQTSANGCNVLATRLSACGVPLHKESTEIQA